MSYFKKVKDTQTQKIRECEVFRFVMWRRLWKYNVFKSNERVVPSVVILILQVLFSSLVFAADLFHSLLILIFIVIPLLFFFGIAWFFNLFDGFFKKAFAILGIIWALYFAWQIYKIGISDATTKTIVQAQAVFSELGLLFKTLFVGAWEFLKGLFLFINL